MDIRLTRDSIALSDDCNAPHEKTITIPDLASLEDILRQVFRSNYLALILKKAT